MRQRLPGSRESPRRASQPPRLAPARIQGSPLGGFAHPDLTYMRTVIPETAQKPSRVAGNSLIQNQAHGRPIRPRCFPSRCLQDWQRRMPAPASRPPAPTPDSSGKVVPVRVDRNGFHDPAYRQPHTADTRLTVHLVRVPRYPIKEPHRFHFDTFSATGAKKPCAAPSAKKSAPPPNPPPPPATTPAYTPR